MIRDKYKKRMQFIAISIIAMAIGIGCILYSFSQNIILFYSPTMLYDKTVSSNDEIRIGGLVKLYSLAHDNGVKTFIITDNEHEVIIKYTGLLPNLFREGQGVVAKGYVMQSTNPIIFNANELLIKHDEYYKPPSK